MKRLWPFGMGLGLAAVVVALGADAVGVGQSRALGWKSIVLLTVGIPLTVASAAAALTYDRKTRARRVAQRDVLAALLVVVAAIHAVKVARHEMWRDELQAWGIATQTDSLGALFGALRYEGHPPVWHLVLRVTDLIWADPAVMQWLTWALGVATAGIILFLAPFAVWLRVATVLSYAITYEYGVVARSYSLQAALFVAACAAVSAQRWRPHVVAVLLAALALTSSFGVVLALSVAAAVPWLHREWRSRRTLAWASGSALLVAGLAYLVRPAPDIHRPTQPPADVEAVLDRVRATWTGLVQLPSSWSYSQRHPQYGPWRMDELALSDGTMVTLLAVLVGFVALALRRERAACAAWITGTVLTAAAVAYLSTLSPRHVGTMFLVVIAALWLQRGWRDDSRLIWRKPASAILATLVVVSVGGAVVVTRDDLRRPFSNASAMARHVEERLPADALIVGETDYGTSGVALLSRRRFYYPVYERFGSYVTWTDPRLCGCSDDEVIASAERLAARYPAKRVTVLATRPITNERLLPLHEVVGGIVGDEDQFLYELAR